MESSPQVSEEESWHLAYSVFIFTVQALASPAQEACEAMGSYNTAWELKDDAMAGSYLLGHGRLSPEQEMSVRHLLDKLSAVPVNDLPGGAGLAPNLTAMRHPSWEPVRAAAAALLAVLAPVTESSRAYLESLGNAP
ncbi:hypothetical protein [Lysobacter xanthus]